MNKTQKILINRNRNMSLKISIFLLLSFVSLSIFSCSEINAPADNLPPAEPKNFTLLGGGDGQAYFRWDQNTEPDLKAYRLYRSENSITSFSLLVELTQTEYVDRFLNYDSTYYYYLTAVDNADNESLPTNIIEVQPLNTSPPQQPTMLNVSGKNDPNQGIKEIRLDWLPANIGDLKNYLVFRGTDPNFTPVTPIGSTNIASYRDTAVQINQIYYYKIIAVDQGLKRSQPSKPASDLILSSPTLISPSGTRFSSSKFQFQGVTDAVYYVVFVGEGQFSNPIWASEKSTTGDVPYTGPALQSKTYYWWVAAYSKDKVVFEDGSEIPSQINSYSLINSFYVE